VNPIKNQLDFIRHLKFLFFALIFVFIFLESFRAHKERMQAIIIGGLGALFFGFFSVIWNLIGYNVAHDLRLLGPLDSAVYLAYYITPFFLFFCINFINKPQKKLNLVFVITFAILLIATKSMGAIGGSFLVLLIYLFKRHGKKILKNKFIKIGLVLITISIVGAIFYSKILPTLQTDYSSFDERGEIWTTSYEFLKEPRNLFFGLGFGQFEAYYIESVDEILGYHPLDHYVLQPHNIFLLFIFHYGILGLIFILFCIYKTISQIIKKKNPTIFIFILLYFFIHGLIDTPIFKNDLLILLILFLELSLGPQIKNLTSNQKPNQAVKNKDQTLL